MIRRIKKILKLIFLKCKYKNRLSISLRVNFRKGLNININNGKIIIKKGVCFNNYCSINSHELIEIEENTILGESVKIYDHNHSYKDKTLLIKDQEYSKGEIHIGKNCWIGSNVVILKGVSIGDNVVIGANVVVYKSIPSNSVVKLNNNIMIEKY